MSIAKIIGDRIRAYRTKRVGVRNIWPRRQTSTTPILASWSAAKKTPRLRAFQKSPGRSVCLFPDSLKISASSSRKIILPAQCYALLQEQPVNDQKALAEILVALIQYKKA